MIKKVGEPEKSSSQSSTVPSTNYEEDFDDFDPRGTSSSSKCLLRFQRDSICSLLFCAL
uniref:Uncharacterized protein n=1 Tax=Solanum tuberosum TaxID=4113 RepID=M1B320_SOLTU